MALEESPFTWGPNGSRMTPEAIAAQRKVAEALMAQGMDFSPIKSWTQGAARVAQGLMGGLDARQADQAERENATESQKMIASLLAGGGSAPAANAPISLAPSAATDTGSSAAAPAVADGSLPRGYRNNNPLNIEAGSFTQGQPGMVGSDGRFARFASMDRGTAAANNLLDIYQNKHGLNTVAGIVGRWAPAGDGNNVSAYATDVASKLGIDPNAPVPPQMRPALIAAMAQHENGRPLPSGSFQVAQAGNGPIPIPQPRPQMPDDGGQPPVSAQVAQVAQPSSPVAPQAMAPVAAVAPQAAPASPAGPLSGVNPALITALTSPYASEGAKKVAGIILQQQMGDKFTYQTTPDGDILALDPHGRSPPKVVYQATPKPITIPEGGTLWDPKSRTVVGQGGEKQPQSVQEYNYYKKTVPDGQPVMDYATWSTAKARAGATNISNNVDMNSGQTYDKVLAEGLGKSHAALSNGVEDSQARARDIAAMQGAVDQIQRNGGTTGGMGQSQVLDLKKTLNAGASALGITTPFSENDISDKEFLQKFNRQMAGAQAKGAVGARVTNFEMQNYLKANPGLDLSVTGNQRLLGIQSQIEQRNIAVGNQIRQATAQAISRGSKIDPVTVQKIITDYDEAHHITDPVNNQDLTQSYTLPEFQGGANAPMAVGHEQNINGIQIKRIK